MITMNRCNLQLCVRVKNLHTSAVGTAACPQVCDVRTKSAITMYNCNLQLCVRDKLVYNCCGYGSVSSDVWYVD
jgi:hypothetical protein